MAEIINIDPREIRILFQNPRYADFQEINFKKIGEDNFKIELNHNIVKDIYYDKLKDHYLMLINGYDCVSSMIELLNSLSNEGFDPNIDDIIVICSSSLLKNNILNKKDLIYVLEGNRKIFALNILLNTKNTLSDGKTLETRKIILDHVSNKYPIFLKKLEDILKKFDESKKVKLDKIEVKLLNKKEETNIDYIWKILNSRHSGNRIGKLNWSRGQVLNIIYQNVNKIREEKFKLKKGEEISSHYLKILEEDLKTFTGKKFSKKDLETSLWVAYCLDVYNSQEYISNHEKITYVNTEKEGNDNDDDIKNLNNQEIPIFNISSLELSMSTIKISCFQGEITLSKAIGLEICVKKWIVTSKLAKNVLDNLIIYIINLIKIKKLNTRNFDHNYENEIKKIISLFDVDKKEMDNLIKKDINKINAKYVPLSLLTKDKYEEKIDFSSFSEEEKKNYLQKIKSIKKYILPILYKIDNLENIWKYKTEHLDDSCKYGLINIWVTELSTILKNKKTTLISSFPLWVFSSALRSTSELLMLMIIKQIINRDNDSELKESTCFNQNNKELYFSFFNKLNEWVKNIDSFNGHKSVYIKTNYKKIFIEKEYENCFKFNQKDNLIEILENINKNKSKPKDLNELKKISNNLDNFIKWAISFEKNDKTDEMNKNGEEVGIANTLNSLIHNPGLIKKIHNDSLKFENLSNEFNKWIDVIMKFIEFILTDVKGMGKI